MAYCGTSHECPSVGDVCDSLYLFNGFMKFDDTKGNSLNKVVILQTQLDEK